MNYLKQIIAFDKWEELHPLSDKAYRLWFKLMAIANASGWDEWLSVPLLKLKSELHTSSDQTIMNARNSLVQAGRIEVRKGKHGKSADYRLIPFSESLSGVPNGDGSGVKSGEDSGELHGVKGGEDSGTYYKQNKTKQNNITTTTPTKLNNATAVKSGGNFQHTHEDVFNHWQGDWGFPNTYISQDLDEWIKEFGPDVIYYLIDYALSKNVKARKADPFMTEVIKNYRAKKVKTVDDAIRVNAEFDSRGNYYSQKPIRRESIPAWMKEDHKKNPEPQPDPRIQHGYVMPDDSMEPIPK